MRSARAAATRSATTPAPMAADDMNRSVDVDAPGSAAVSHVDRQRVRRHPSRAEATRIFTNATPIRRASIPASRRAKQPEQQRRR